MEMTKEQKEAQIAQLIAGVKTLNDEMPGLKEQIKGIAKQVEGVDAKGILEQIDKLKSGFDKVKSDIARNAASGPGGVPGLEDEAHKFSMIRACMGVKMGGTSKAFENAGAGFEWEAMSQVRDALAAKNQQVGIDSQGGFFVPDQVIPDVIAAIYTRAAFIDMAGDGQTRVSVIDGLVGNKVTIPKAEGGVIAYWIGEEDAYAESRMRVGQVNMSPKKIGVLTGITNEMRRFQSYGFENLLRNDMIRALAKKLDWTIAYGSGNDNTPRGLVNMNGVLVYRAENGTVYESPAAAREASGSSNFAGGELTFDGIDNMMGALEDRDIDVDNFSIVSAPRYFRRLRQLKITNFSGQTADQPYLLGAPMLKDDTLRALIGDFGKTTQVKSAQTAGKSVAATAASANEYYGDVFGGNLSEVVVGRWSGIEIEDDEGKGTGFTSDISYTKMRMYADVGHRQEKALIFCPDAQMRN